MFMKKPFFKFMTVAGVSAISTLAQADPVIEGNAIVVKGNSDTGWYQIQKASGNYDNVCQFSWTANSDGEQRCVITESGSYQVINHTTAERFPVLDVNVTNNIGNNDSDNNTAVVNCSTITPRVQGNSIILNAGCSWTVQRDTSEVNSCDGNIASCDNLVAGNYTVWRWSGANNQFDLQVGDGNTNNPTDISDTGTTAQTRGSFPVHYDVDGIINLNNGQYDVSIDGTGNYFFDWAVINFNGCNWDGPITADVDEPIGVNGGEFSLDLRNNNQFGVGHCETDIAVTKTGYRNGNGYPKAIRSIEASSNSNESNLKVTSRGRWDSGSTGRGHVNMTVWLTNSEGRDHSSRAACHNSSLTNAQLNEMGCGTVDVIIHGFDNSGDMAQNSGWEILDTTVSMQDPENPGQNINYHIIKRSGDFGERSSYNIQPVHRAANPYTGGTAFPTQNYDMEFDVMTVINAIIDSDDSAPFTKDWFVHDMQWTITGQSGNSVGGTRINGIDGKFTFDRFTIPSFSASTQGENWTSETGESSNTNDNSTGSDTSSSACTVAGNTFAEAIASYADNCSLPRSDCDLINGQWYCSSGSIGSNPVVTSGANSTSQEPEPQPEPETDAPTISYTSPGSTTTPGQVTISGKANDASGIRLVRALILGRDQSNQRYNFSTDKFSSSTVYADTVKTATLSNVSATSADWGFTVPNLSPGDYTLRTKLWDTLNNASVWFTYNFTVEQSVSAPDTAAPTITYISPANQTGAGAVTVSGKADDASGIRLFRALLLNRDQGNQRYNFKTNQFSTSTVYADTVKTATLTNQSNAGADWSFSIPNLAPGNYRLLTKAWDTLNNSTSWIAYNFTATSNISEREGAMRQAMGALESYHNANGTYIVPNSGWRGNGSGWFFYDGANYPNSVADALTGAGHPVLLTDPLYANSTSVRGDYLIYHCKNRVGLFSRHGTAAEVTSAADATWWNSNGCPRHPLDTLNSNYFLLSQ